MSRVFEKIIERLTNAGGCDATYNYDKGWDDAIGKAISIVQEVGKEHNDGWILCSDRLPESHPTIFAKLKGTEKWDPNMPERMSDEVIATVKFEDGTRRTVVTKTVDGIWKQKFQTLKYKVIAWKPLPEPLMNE